MSLSVFSFLVSEHILEGQVSPGLLSLLGMEGRPPPVFSAGSSPSEQEFGPLGSGRFFPECGSSVLHR